MRWIVELEDHDGLRVRHYVKGARTRDQAVRHAMDNTCLERPRLLEAYEEPDFSGPPPLDNDTGGALRAAAFLALVVAVLACLAVYQVKHPVPTTTEKQAHE